MLKPQLHQHSCSNNRPHYTPYLLFLFLCHRLMHRFVCVCSKRKFFVFFFFHFVRCSPRLAAAALRSLAPAFCRWFGGGALVRFAACLEI